MSSTKKFFRLSLHPRTKPSRRLHVTFDKCPDLETVREAFKQRLSELPEGGVKQSLNSTYEAVLDTTQYEKYLTDNLAVADNAPPNPLSPSGWDWEQAIQVTDEVGEWSLQLCACFVEEL